jgi:cytochrome P450/NADPH-cytochrome P450 reductase
MPTYTQINKLTYIQQILKESLRLWPTAPAFALYPYEDTIIGGKYPVTRKDEIAVLIPMLHRDKRVWGDDAEEFKPERFSPEREAALPPNAYKPFGNGQRACIGRQFAMQEATLVMGMLLQRFKLIDHTNYELKIRETLTLKPDNFKIKVRKREDSERKIVVGQVQTVQKPACKAEPVRPIAKHHTPLLVLFGSNMGTAEDLARQVAEDGEIKGFDTAVASLDDYTNKLPKDGAVIIITASYNGTPPDNAAAFCGRLRSGNIPADALIERRSWRNTNRSSTCSKSAQPVRFHSVFTWKCCQSFARDTTRSHRHHCRVRDIVVSQLPELKVRPDLVMVSTRVFARTF